jgi:hypothetical protein
LLKFFSNPDSIKPFSLSILADMNKNGKRQKRKIKITGERKKTTTFAIIIIIFVILKLPYSSFSSISNINSF